MTSKALPMTKKKPKGQKKTDQSLQENKTAQKQINTHIARATYQGPLPLPHMLAQYDEVVPGAADRIITMAESQSKDRQKMESSVIAAGIKDSLLGLISAFLIGVTTVVGGTICVLKGVSTGGTILSGSAGCSYRGFHLWQSAKKEGKRRES
jgi:uncharacterized membrane protein